MNYNWGPYAIGGATRPDSFSSMVPAMQEGLWGMLQAADQELGGGLQVYSGYRSPELQSRLYQDALKKYGSEKAARKWVAPPGRSRHNTGQAADLKYNGKRIDQAPKEIQDWVRNNANRFGLSVPMSWEPWQVEVAGARGGKPMSYGAKAVPPTQPMPNAVPTPMEVSGQPLDFGALAGIFAEQQPQNIWEQLAAATRDNQAFAAPQPQAPIMAPPVQAYEAPKRDTTQPYLQLFQSLMG